MVDNENETKGDENHRITVEAADVDGIVAALGMELVEKPAAEGRHGHPDELHTVLETLADIYAGVEQATESDSRGRSRKMVRQYADREDLTSDDVGHLLRVLEAHELVVQDGNRWRLSGSA